MQNAMAQSSRECALKEMRAIIGPDASERHMIHSLHLARDNLESALNIYFDTPQGELLRPAPVARKSGTARQNVPSKPEVRVTVGPHSSVPAGVGACSSVAEPPTPVALTTNAESSLASMSLTGPMFPSPVSVLPIVESSASVLTSEDVNPSSAIDHLAFIPLPKESPQGSDKPLKTVVAFPTQSTRKVIPNLTKSTLRIHLESSHSTETELDLDPPSAHVGEWMLLGASEVMGCSTCRGSKVQIGDQILFSFPKSDQRKPLDGRRLWSRAKGPAEIVRFSSPGHGEIGRLPKDWATCLIPLVHANKIKLEGRCRDAPAVLEIMSNIHINVRVYMNRNLFTKFESLWRSPLSSSEATTNLPLPSLLTFLGHKPVMKAEFTPEDLLSRKRLLDAGKHNMQEAGTLRGVKRHKLADGASETDNGDEELSDKELSELVGVSDNVEIQEMEPSSALVCSLWPYQKQALYWMTKRETGVAVAEVANVLHPCWEAYSSADKRVPRFYLNVFTGEATLDFPSAMQTAKGGILADAMGLGKTVMTISLIVTNPGKGGLGDANKLELCEASPVSFDPSQAQPSQLKPVTEKGGGTLIVCPMSLLAQWKSEFDAHVVPGHVKVHTYYGGDRNKDLEDLLNYDVVLTTYNTLQSEFSKSGRESPLQSVHWFRIVLDEAHAIKNSRSSCAQSIFALTADRSWCLTGTPIQNKLEDVFSLLHFLRVEPWANWAWWNKLIQKPFDEGDERALPLLQYVLRPLMLRRTKDTKDKDGRAILKLPPADMGFVYCDLSDPERDFYEAIHKKSKIKFDRFVEQGKVLHNYASILEMLLRMRQCCDHPFLVLSRSDTEEFSDLDKLAKRFLSGDAEVEQDAALRPTKAYVNEVVAELRNGDNTECPICLEAMEDSVLTPCAHRMCRECLFASWRSSGGGKCPLCRAPVSKQDLITAPSNSRFHIDVEKNWTESSKITVLMQHLDEARLAGSKSVIFSQWTAFLDLLEIPLKRRKLQFVRLDGSLSQHQRQKVLEEFSSNPETTMMLLSLKAGGVGLNLTAASNAFLLDPWWNPAVEDQAIMRIHRIGQTKPVVVKRFVVRGTVEEKMLQVQARKQRMITGALTDQHDVKYARIEELKMLFR